MAKITNTETPEDFALHLLDQLMEEQGEKLTTFQILQAAQAYATAGVAQATREAGGSMDSLADETQQNVERLIEENVGRAQRLKGESPVVEFVAGAGIPSQSYNLITDGNETYWAHREATTEEIDAGIALIRFFNKTEEAGELEHVSGIKTPPAIARASDPKPEGAVYDIFHRTEGEFWVRRDVLISELPQLIKELQDAEDKEWMDYAGELKSRGATATPPPVTTTVSFSGDVYEKEPTKELPKTLREKIEAEIASRAEVPEEESANA